MDWYCVHHNNIRHNRIMLNVEKNCSKFGSKPLHLTLMVQPNTVVTPLLMHLNHWAIDILICLYHSSMQACSNATGNALELPKPLHKAIPDGKVHGANLVGPMNLAIRDRLTFHGRQPCSRAGGQQSLEGCKHEDLGSQGLLCGAHGYCIIGLDECFTETDTATSSPTYR